MTDLKYPKHKIFKDRDFLTSKVVVRGYGVRFLSNEGLWVMMGYRKTKEEALGKAQATFNQSHRGAGSFKEV